MNVPNPRAAVHARSLKRFQRHEPPREKVTRHDPCGSKRSRVGSGEQQSTSRFGLGVLNADHVPPRTSAPLLPVCRDRAQRDLRGDPRAGAAGAWGGADGVRVARPAPGGRRRRAEAGRPGRLGRGAGQKWGPRLLLAEPGLRVRRAGDGHRQTAAGQPQATPVPFPEGRRGGQPDGLQQRWLPGPRRPTGPERATTRAGRGKPGEIQDHAPR